LYRIRYSYNEFYILLYTNTILFNNLEKYNIIKYYNTIMPLLNNFTPTGTNAGSIPQGVGATAETYDYKNSAWTRLVLSLQNSNRHVTQCRIVVATGQDSITYNGLSALTNDTDNPANKILEIDFLYSSVTQDTIRNNTIEYNFQNLTSYKIFYLLEYKEVVDSVPIIYKLSYTQNFTYYETPVTLSDFTFTREGTTDDHFQNGDNLEISGLLLNHGTNVDSNGNIIDTSVPENQTIEDGIIIYSILFTIEEQVASYNDIDFIEYIQYEAEYNPEGYYLLENLELTTGKSYKVTANASWELGYSVDSISTQQLSILNRPSVTAVDIKSLYVKEIGVNDSIVDITIDPIVSGPSNVVSKIWFEFYNTSNALVAKAGGATGFNIQSGSNIYSLNLSDFAVISNGGILIEEDHKVKTLVQYTLGQYRRSDPFPEVESEYTNFTKSIPKIVGHTIHSLYTSDPTENIVTIDVEKQSYQLYAPNVTNGIKFHFYDGAALVASTSSYTFVNSAGTGNVSYPIKLSEVTPGVLVVDKDYRIKAEVTLVKHSGVTEQRLSELSSATESIPDKVNFTKSIPEIVSHTINPLYTSNPLEKILDINVKKQAYQLYAPVSSLQEKVIKFHFYDGAALVASTSLYTFVNSSGAGSVSYPILLSEVTPGVLVNNKDYRIKAEVTLVKHDGTPETRLSELSSATESIPDKVNFSLKKPFINNVTSYDFQVDGDDESYEQIIANIIVRKELYELVAPTSSGGIKFLIFNSDGTTLVATTTSYTFQNSSANPSTEYSITLNDVVIESGQQLLKNGIVYKVKVEVTIIKHSGDTELRISDDFKELKGTQATAPISSVSTSNSWALATGNVPSSSSTRFNASPNIGISGFFKKTPQFNGGSILSHLDIDSTKFRIEYKVGEGSWSYVQKAVLLQKSNSESLQEAVSRINAESVVSSANGEYANVIGSGPGRSQPEMIFFIPQQQVTGTNAFTESDQVKIRISVVDPTDMWQSSNGGISEPRESNSLQLINKINTYDFVVGSSSEPFNTFNGEGHLFLNIPVDWKSTHAHSVKVGYKYVSSDSYSYSVFSYEPTTTISFEVDPITGTTLYYSVAYIVNNVNISSTATTEGPTIEKNVSIKLFPSSSDYSITNTSYKTFNTGGKSSITFNLAFNITSTTRIDGVNVYFTSPDSSQGSAIEKKRIATFNPSQGGNTKTIQLLHAGSTINYATTLNFTPLNTINASGTIVTDLSVVWQDFDLANISFEAYRDRRVISSNASYGTTNYVESGLINFDKTIWNVPVLNSPGWNGPITLEGGVRNSSTATKLLWAQIIDPNNINFTYHFTMMKNDNSASLIHNDSSLAQNFKNLDIDLNANAKYNASIATVFAPSTAGSMREVSAYPDTIEFHTIHMDVLGINITVNNPSNITKVNLLFNDVVVSGNSVTSDGVTSASFDNNVVEQHVIYSTTNPTNALTRLAPSTNNVIERILTPLVPKEYNLPITSPGTMYSFFMKLKALINYKVTSYTNSTPNVVVKTTDSVVIADQTLTTDSSKYVVSSIPIIGTTFTITPNITNGNPTLNFLLDANGLEDEGFISVVMIIAEDGTENKPDGEAAILLFPDTGTTSNYTNNIAGSGLGVDPRLAGGESFTTTPRNLAGAVMGTAGGEYTLTIGDVNSTTGRFNKSTLTMPFSSVSGFTSGSEVNVFVLLTTRRGTNFATRTFTYTPPVIVQNLNISRSGSDFYANFDVNGA